MIHGLTLGVLHELVSWLLYPVLAGLALALVIVLWEIGGAIAELCGSLKRHQQQGLHRFGEYAQQRLERVDLLARSGPILGLMGTLIPLGPGLSALGSGNLDILATAMTVAFDTTVLGLLIGLLGYILGRIRRRWYDSCWTQLSQSSEVQSHE